MKRARIEDMTVAQLVDRFVAIALEQHEAIRREENSKYNRLFGEMGILTDELKRRPGDQRRALISLYKHPNAQVRLKAAIVTLALAPDAARNTLKKISDWNEYPEAPDARGILMGLDDGSYTPT